MQKYQKVRLGPVSPGELATITRRNLLRCSVVAATTLLLAACSGPLSSGQTGNTSASSSTAVVPAPTQGPATPAASPTSAVAATAPTSPAVSATSTGAAAAAGQATALPATDASTDGDEAITPSSTEGPYFKPNSPERTSLVDSGVTGTKLTLTGRVLSTRAQPIAKALLDFWQADAQGSYDNTGYTLRGHQFSGAEGQYQLVTVIPGLYPGRTRHIHVKVQAPNQPALTTQLFFPNEPQNNTDSIFSPKLVLPIQDAPDGSKVATFNFVLNVG